MKPTATYQRQLTRTEAEEFLRGLDAFGADCSAACWNMRKKLRKLLSTGTLGPFRLKVKCAPSDPLFVDLLKDVLGTK